MKKKPYTNKDLFEIIVNTLKEKGLLPDILDYSKPDITTEEIKTYEFDICGDLAFGGSEGAYLTVFIEGCFGRDRKRIYLGTFKTLNEDLESFRTMATLEADFIWYGREFVEDNLDDFEWTGYRVKFFSGETCKMDCSTTKMSRAQDLIKKRYKYEWDYAVIIDNSTKKEVRINRSEVNFG